MSTYWIQDHPALLLAIVAIVVLLFVGISAINRKKDKR
jgi:hypothetical protein